MRFFLSTLFFTTVMLPSGYAAMAQAQAPVAPAPAAAFDAKEAATAVTDLATALEENFVFPDAGKRYGAMLRTNLAKGAYASFPTAQDFAERVTADLQAVHKDGHLRLRPLTAEMRARGGSRGPGGPGGEDRSAVSRSGWLAPGVAYIDFAGFPGNKATTDEVAKFLADYRDAGTLIIDARKNGGGGLDEMNLLFRELYAQPTTLVTMDIRQAVEEKHGTPFGDDPTMQKIAGPATVIRREHRVFPAATPGPLARAKVYLLTSKKTFSAAEHLSLALKRTGRATLVGETTGGGAHFGGTVPMGTGYAAFIPVGRTFDATTGNSWEGTGVSPHVAVPADQALAKALELAGVRVEAEAALSKLGPPRASGR